ncbi:MAG: hypothetical protein J7501_05190 [Bdellovibrio sp.]|nr:hypothetical protein [Bdellovibrio sp.]
MKFLLSVIILVSAFVTQAHAEISEVQFNSLISLFQKQYPDISFQGSWFNDTVNAQAMRFDDAKLVVIYGGLARDAATTADSFALMVCHEVGHHLGDGPYFPAPAGSITWAAGEGAADYFAVHGCFNQLAASIPAQSLSLPSDQVTSLKQLCSAQSSPVICARAAVAGLMVAKLQWNVLPEENPEPRIGGHDSSKVGKTLLDYASPQCRLDTFIASALGSARPACWSH